MGCMMKCNKGHDLESFVIKNRIVKIHRVHCPVCKVVIDFNWMGLEISKTVKQFAPDEFFYIDGKGRLVDDNYWLMYGSENR